LIEATAMSAPLRILYVEDNDLVREVTTELLLLDERHIVAAATAEDALREFSEQPFDVMITDVSLPAMSGIDLVRKVLAMRPQTAVIVATGYPLDLTRERWGSRVRTILKPFDGTQIDALIAEVCAETERAT
jgi:CheY-like chemotaxis protein